MKIQLLLFLIALYNYQVEGLTSPSVNPSNPNFQCGFFTIISSGILSTTNSTFPVTFTTTMSTNSVKAALGIVMNEMTLSGTSMGFDVYIVSVSASQMFISALSTTTTNPVTKMNVCYMVSLYAALHVNYNKYPFSSATDSVLNSALTDATVCPSIGTLSNTVECRSKGISLTYPAIGNTKRAIALMSGFVVNSFRNGVGSNPSFGLGFFNQNPQASSLDIRVIVFGRLELTSVSAYYINYQVESLNIYGDKVIISGSSSAGCSIDWGALCQITDPANINTTITTSSTGFNSFSSTNYFLGFSSYIGGFDGSAQYGMNFAVGATSLTGTAYQSGYVYSGNPDGKFKMTFHYLIILEFYCPDTGTTDIYYAHNSNSCNNTCNNWISQYADVNRICRLCDPVCFKCTGAPNICTACYIAQNKINSGNQCICNTIGYYDDNTSLTCPSCHYSCLSCTGPSASQCIDCLSSSKRTIDINSCFCNPRFYDNGVNQVCPGCHYTCFTCSGTSATNCLTCSASDYRTVLSSNNSCPCIVGYYDLGSPNTVCAACHYSCLTCSNTGPSACSTCNPTFEFRTQSGSTCPCSTGYYDNLNPVCALCHVTCTRCNGPTRNDCTQCDNTKQRALESAQCKCKAQFYEFNLTCYACHYSCFNCTGATKNQCINCNSGVTFRNLNTSNNNCYCIDGYMDLGPSISVCSKCDRTCLTCQNATTTCLSCDSAKNRQQAGNTCPCRFGYIDTMLVTGFCSKCHYSCLTCSGVSATQCQSCVTTWRTLIGGSCLCKTRTYDNGITFQCSSCHQQCLQCTDQYQTTCKTCDAALKRQIVGAIPKPCTCIQRWFQNNNALLCEACHYSCLTCSVVSTNCTSCSLGTDRRYASGSACLCDAHYYDVGSSVCGVCFTTCQNCSVNPNNCTSCYTDRYLLNNKCLCNIGTYEDIFLACQPCHYSCSSCQNSSRVCLSCPSFTYRVLNNATCPCSFGYYDNNAMVCTPCPYSCNGCTGPSPPQCISCPVSSFRTLQPDKSCPCNSGYFDDGTSPICKACTSTCLSCTSFSVCTACNPVASQFRTLVSNVCRCIAGYYDNLVNPVCQVCHYSCVNCFGGLDTNCFSCKVNRAFQVGSPSCPCQNGFYQSTQICYPCDTSCSTCLGVSTNCTSCDTTIRYLQSNKCLCRDGYFQNGGVCTSCNPTCASCNLSSTNCLSCISSHLTILNGTSCVCLLGQYRNPTTLVCMSCNIKCATCSGAGETACSSCSPTSFRTYNPVTMTCDCNSGYIDSGLAACSPCHSSCLTCYGPTEMNCLSCHAGAAKMGSSCRTLTSCTAGFSYEGYCVSVCPNSTYPSVNTCITCINNCKTCLSATICTTCAEGYIYNRTSQRCTVNCVQGFYIDKVNRTCESCPLGCDLCVQRNNTILCQKCGTGYYMFNHTSCVDSNYCSIPNFVKVGLLCFACEHPCETCQSIAFNGCLSCKQGYSLLNGQCLSVCPQSMYSFKRSCLSCDGRCKQCSSTQCELCKEGFYLNPYQQNPICITNSYFYDSSTLAQIKCHPNCLSCTNSSFSSCISCVKFRGDATQMARSGYCQCWQDSIDIGEGKCSYDSFQTIKTYTKVLTSSTDTALYAGAVASAFSDNFISTASFMLYQQSYSVLYFVNMSILLQTDQYLEEALDKNINFYLNSKASKGNQSRVEYSQLLTDLQSDMSLFARGYEFELYLFNWAFYTVVGLGSLGVIILVLNFLLQCKCISDNQTLKRVFITGKSIFQESSIVVVHLLTISEISLYSAVTFKFILTNFDSLQINWIHLGLSVGLATYYLFYIFRLIVGCCCIGKSQSLQTKYEYNPLRLLVYGFEDDQKGAQGSKMKQKKMRFADISLSKKLFIPLLMVRMSLSSVLVVYFSSNPVIQVVSLEVVMVAWTLYSIICCPYHNLFKFFIHLNQLVYIAQIGMVLYSILQQDSQKLLPAYVQLILNGIQVGTMIVFSITMGVRMVYGVCKQSKKTNNNRVGNIYFSQHSNSHSELYLNDDVKENQENGQAVNYQKGQLNEKFRDQTMMEIGGSNDVSINNIEIVDKELLEDNLQEQVNMQEFVIKKRYRAVKKTN